MNGKLLLQTLVKFIVGLVVISLLLFLPAGTVHFWNGWLLISVLFVPMFLLGIILLIKAPDLLAKRLNTREKESEQKQVILLSFLMFVSGFIVSGLDFRFGWSHLPSWLAVLVAILLVAAYGMYAEVMRENAYLSRTVEVQENQQVIDTGLYGVVRHPMYTATVILFLAMPLVLGSIPSFIIFLLYPFLLVKRIRNEE
ncbi:isoprenylcysteine carboxylmethyltransferase family protein [uncultured Enterococcus sp.]|uniref:methyltransferase family protein n=1 Tax=uncultured Enterococcus sp. TaxID=167972 RepID=UPI002AA75655|nr:isoprenylcysteine carboxylmethyltransferase family protein [uncultured Enterococcus sp.]